MSFFAATRCVSAGMRLATYVKAMGEQYLKFRAMYNSADQPGPFLNRRETWIFARFRFLDQAYDNRPRLRSSSQVRNEEHNS